MSATLLSVITDQDLKCQFLSAFSNLGVIKMYDESLVNADIRDL